MSSIQYTSRSFLTVLNDINNDSTLVDKPVWFKNLMAGVLDTASMYQDAVANQSFLRTAFTRQSVADLLALIDYQMTPQTTSSGIALFFVSRTASFPVTVSKSDLVATTSGGISASSLRFEARADQTFTAFSETFTTDYTTDLCTVARQYYLGDLIRVTTSGTLPAPLQINTDYYVIPVSATTIKLATSKLNAFAGNYINLTTNGTGNQTAVLYSFPVTVYQQTTVSSTLTLGTSDGITSWQSFNLPDLDVLKDTIAVNINSFAWSRVDSLVYSVSTDLVYRLLYNTDNSSYIQFSNGTYGSIPPNFPIIATYSFGGGANSNISALNSITLYAGGNSNITGVTNPSTLTGGADPQSIEDAKILGPILLKTRDRFVTIEDGVALVLRYGGISSCSIAPNYYGILSCQITCVPTGGGVLSGATKSALVSYLQSRSILDSVNIQIVDATYVPTNFTSQLKVLSGYTYANVKPYYELGVRLLISERTQEIYNAYFNQNIETAVSLINTIWSYSFTSADYTQIKTLLDNVNIPAFGVSIQLSYVESLLKMVNGVDYFTITVPASFPVTFASNAISTVGTVTTTAI